MASPKLDNQTYRQKMMLRQLVMKRIAEPVVMETHGGFGHIGNVVYAGVARGVVFEKDEARADVLARQRPTWAVYNVDSERAIRAGAGAHLAVNMVDLDPYGDPWPTIEAFFTSKRPRADELHLVVTDGLRSKARMRASWSSGTLAEMVRRYGNELFPVYLQICRELMGVKAAAAGYTVAGFHGYYCGRMNAMTHYAARLTR